MRMVFRIARTSISLEYVNPHAWTELGHGDGLDSDLKQVGFLIWLSSNKFVKMAIKKP